MADLDQILQGQSGAQQPSAQGGQPPTGMGGGGLAGILNRPQQPAQGAGGARVSHAATVAGLNHFGAVEKAFDNIVSNAKFGRDSVRIDVYNELSKLVGQKYMTIPQVMELMKTFPTDPIDQRRWIMQQYDKMKQARMMLLEHRSQSAQNEDPRMPQPDYDPDRHEDHMSDLLQQYPRQGGRR